MGHRISFSKKQIAPVLVTSIFLLITSIGNLYAQVNKNEGKINALVKQMTLEEKVG